MTPEAPPSPAPPREAASRRRTPLLVAGLGLVALLAAVGLISRGSGEDAERAPAETAAEGAEASRRGAASPGGAGGSSEAALAVEEAEAAPRRFTPETCWRDIERFNEAVTIDTFRDWAAPLFASKDPLVRDYLKERLTELIGNDAGRAGQVLAWARDAQGADFKVYLSALRDSEAVQQPQVVTQVMAAGLDPALEGGRRAGLLSALDTQKRLEPATLDRLARFAQDPASGEAGWAATRSIARVMTRDFERTGTAAPYLDKLLTIGTESPDEQIRYLAQSMPMHAAPVLDAQATARFTKILTTEGNEDGRDAAAHNLSLSEDKAGVLRLFEETFAREPSECVRWALFRFSARVAGKDALPLMANMALSDPRFQRDYQIFSQLYASGTLDFMRVWNALPDQDPHNCMDHHQ